MSLIFMYLIVQLLIQIIFKPKLNTLNCGLFGGCFNQAIDETMMQKIKMLGFFNQSRGRDSCGYFNGDKIVKGVDKDKEFYDFVVNKGIEYNTGTNNVFIGHTRQATAGAHTEANAHPFNIDDKLILAHNGTISNIWELCTKYEINHTMMHVDSLGLGHILAKGETGVLSEYKGYAALLMHRLKEKNALYVYHGSSRDTKDGAETEERPLFYLETKEGIYLSSLETALKFIKEEGDGDPTCLPHNKIFKIKNGKIQKKPVLEIDRGDSNVKYYPPVVANTYNKMDGFPNYNDYDEDAWLERPGYSNYNRTGLNRPVHNQQQRIAQFDSYVEETGVDILKETIPFKVVDKLTINAEQKFVYWHRGRYYEGGSGKLCEGVYKLNRKTGDILEENEEVPKDVLMYFFQGVMIKDKFDFESITKAISSKTGSLYYNLTSSYNNFAKAISDYSRYPVTNLEGESAALAAHLRKRWYLKDMFADIPAVTPLFATRNYHFKNGILKKVATDKSDPAFVSTLADDIKKELEKRKEEKENFHEADVLDTKVGTGQSNKIEYDETVKAYAENFDKVYNSLEDAVEGLGDICMEALELYMEEVLINILDHADDVDMVCAMHEDLINDAVAKKVTIRSLIDCQISSIEYYISDILTEIENSEDLEDDEGLADSKENKYEEVNKLLTSALKNEDEEVIKNDKKPYIFEEDVSNIDKTVEDEEAIYKVANIASNMEHLYKLADELQLLNSSDIAQEMSKEIYVYMDQLRDTLKERLQNAKHTEAASKIKKLNNTY